MLNEWKMMGAYGMPAQRFDTMLAMVNTGRLRPGEVASERVGLDQVSDVMTAMGLVRHHRRGGRRSVLSPESGERVAGRPREFDRDEALRKAQTAFWSGGYETTSMSELVTVLGLASARIYAAFGSKEALFRETIELYKQHEGGFVERILAAEPTARGALERILREAVLTYTRPGEPRGCMVVSSAANCSPANGAVFDWLANIRSGRTKTFADIVGTGVESGEFSADTDVQAVGDAFAAMFQGISVQARDGVSRERLLALIKPAMTMLDQRLA